MRRIKMSLLSALAFASLTYGQQPEETLPIEDAAAKTDMSSSVMIRLVDPLDEPEFYCLDVPGHGSGVQLESPLTAHTLKAFGSADEMWVLNYPATGQIYVPAYKRIIESERAEAGASLYLKPPSDSPLQRFTMKDDGSIVLTEHTELAFAVAPGVGEPTRGPSHLFRKMGLAKVADTPEKLARWKLVEDADSWPE
jgi:hypothetical protein